MSENRHSCALCHWWFLSAAAACLSLFPAGVSATVIGPYTASVLYTLGPPNGVSLSNLDYSGNPQSAIGGQVVGQGAGSGTGNNYHALLWNNSGTATDLNPAGFTSSSLSGTIGTQQVGTASGISTGNHDHATLWNGT